MSNPVVQLSVRDGIEIYSLPPQLWAAIAYDLKIPNPRYYEAKKYGRSTWKIPPNIELYQTKNNRQWMRVPRGYWSKLLLRLKEHGAAYELEDARTTHPVGFNILQAQLRGYQEPVVHEAFLREQGVIESPCGSGKTVMGIFLLARCGQKTLWITHTKELLIQTVAAMASILGEPKDSIGIIGSGMKSFGEKVTAGLVQSLINLDPDLIRNEFGTVIVDEAHRVPSKTFKEIVENTSAKYRFGLTATPRRSDGLESILFHVMGPVAYKITEEDLVAEGQILIPEVYTIQTPFVSQQLDDYNKLMAEIVDDAQRNQLIVETIVRTMQKGDTALVLSGRVTHCHTLKRLLDDASNLKTAILTGSVDKKKRQEIMENARSGTVDLVFATKLADEGLDIPGLTKLYLATPQKARAKVKQQLGRVMRLQKGKEAASIFDFVDYRVPLLRRQYKLRELVYREMGCKF